LSATTVNKTVPLPTSIVRLKPSLRGARAEAMACEFLVDQGLKLKARNYRTRRGEIDLIMQAQDCVVFIEVKYRKNSRFGTAEASITKGKSQKMTAAAQEYLIRNGYPEDTGIRFDAVLLSESEDAVANCTLNWIQNILT